MSNLADVLTDFNELSAYSLASTAECLSPDSLQSAGAAFLTSVRDSVVELAGEIPAEEIPHADITDRLHEIADGAPDVYTHTLWAEFVDLGAYNEDPTELGGDGSDMTRTAGVCLYLIAHRLAFALWEDIREAAEEDADAAVADDQADDEPV